MPWSHLPRLSAFLGSKEHSQSSTRRRDGLNIWLFQIKPYAFQSGFPRSKLRGKKPIKPAAVSVVQLDCDSGGVLRLRFFEDGIKNPWYNVIYKEIIRTWTGYSLFFFSETNLE
jgi:hypothetical protein